MWVKNTRTLRIYLPPEYSDNEDCKVLLLNDGLKACGMESLLQKEDWRIMKICIILSIKFNSCLFLGRNNLITEYASIR
jgi:hypothetical protein